MDNSRQGYRADEFLIGNAEPVCPCCATLLDKMPGRKAKCQHCGQFMYVRTRLSDRKRVLVTETQAKQIEEQWNAYNGPDSVGFFRARHVSIEDEEFRKERVAIAVKFGGTPTDNDVYWSIYNKRIIRHSRNWDWGLYRNVRFGMAEVLRSDNKLDAALSTYLEVSYLDSNGPRNLGGLKNDAIALSIPSFDRNNAFQAPAIITAIMLLAANLGLGKQDIQNTYMKIAESVHVTLRLPITPQEAWHDLQAELAKK